MRKLLFKVSLYLLPLQAIHKLIIESYRNKDIEKLGILINRLPRGDNKNYWVDCLYRLKDSQPRYKGIMLVGSRSTNIQPLKIKKA